MKKPYNTHLNWLVRVLKNLQSVTGIVQFVDNYQNHHDSNVNLFHKFINKFKSNTFFFILQMYTTKSR